MPQRRHALQLVGLAAGAFVLGGHTPYRQWVVYRKKHLLIGCQRDDPPSYDLAKRIVAMLEVELPAARARVARAPDARRLASLLGTNQLEVALLRPNTAVAMHAGSMPFEPYGPAPIHLLANVGDHLLVCRDDFALDHADLVVHALADLISVHEVPPPLPLHMTDAH